jgi:hypothetical protein
MLRCIEIFEVKYFAAILSCAWKYLLNLFDIFYFLLMMYNYIQELIFFSISPRNENVIYT